MERKDFKVGDLVQWTSQAGGYTLTKKGKVLSVLAPGFSVFQMLATFGDWKKMFRSRISGGGTRDHVSYIIEVAGPTSKSKSLVYWPIASLLKPMVAVGLASTFAA